jgi:hypothetical protein
MPPLLETGSAGWLWHPPIDEQSTTPKTTILLISELYEVRVIFRQRLKRRSAAARSSKCKAGEEGLCPAM